MAANSTPTSKTTDMYIKAARIPEALCGSLKTQFERALQLLGAGWHGPNDIQTLTGLEGQFLWPEDFFSVRVIAFAFDSDKIGLQGSYKLSSGLSVVEEGMFHSVPNNPAMGFAAVTLAPRSGEPPRTSIVSGLFSDATWKIYTMLLNKLGPEGPMQPPFSAVRIG